MIGVIPGAVGGEVLVLQDSPFLILDETTAGLAQGAAGVDEQNGKA